MIIYFNTYLIKSFSLSQILYWLPKVLPPKAHLIVSVISTEVEKVTELTEERGYTAINIVPLKEKEREEIALVR